MLGTRWQAILLAPLRFHRPAFNLEETDGPGPGWASTAEALHKDLERRRSQITKYVLLKSADPSGADRYLSSLLKPTSPMQLCLHDPASGGIVPAAECIGLLQSDLYQRTVNSPKFNFLLACSTRHHQLVKRCSPACESGDYVSHNHQNDADHDKHQDKYTDLKGCRFVIVINHR